MPRSAELKLIKMLQERVHKRTKRYDQDVPKQLRVTEEGKEEAVEISRKQGKVEKLTRKLANRINKEGQARIDEQRPDR